MKTLVKARQLTAQKLSAARPVVGRLARRVGFLALAALACLFVLAASAGAGMCDPPTYTIPDVSGFAGTFTDTQTFATNLVTGPGRAAIYVGLVLAGFTFVWRMIKRGLSGH